MAELRQKTLLDQLDQKRKLNSIVVPTADPAVRKALRALGEPITLFGEGVPERRDRLKLLTLAAREADPDGADGSPGDTQDGEGEGEEAEEEFYHEGTKALLEARQDIARYTLRRAKYKLAFLKAQQDVPLKAHVAHRNEIKKSLEETELTNSAYADRPVSAVRFSPDGKYLAVSDWGGNVKLLDVPELKEEVTFHKSHSERVRGMAWLPGATTSLTPTVANFITGGSEGDIQLWPLGSPGDKDVAPLATIHAHPREATEENVTGEIRKLAVHPSGKYIATASSHKTWALFRTDASPSDEPLMEGYGHSDTCTAIAFDPSGTLLLSGGADAVGRIWDLRTGRTIMLLSAHERDILGADWAPDGARCVTGSADGLGIIWDVRAVRDTARLPLHSRGVTDLQWWRGRDGACAFADAAATADPPPPTPRFTGDAAAPLPRAGAFLLSAGFDRLVSVTSAGDWAPVRALRGHNSHVLSVDASAEDARWIASGGWDRTVKIWGRRDGEGF